MSYCFLLVCPMSLVMMLLPELLLCVGAPTPLTAPVLEAFSHAAKRAGDERCGEYSEHSCEHRRYPVEPGSNRSGTIWCLC